MPWTVQKRKSQYCVIGEDGESRGCHKTRAEATRQLRALYANVPDARKEADLWQDMAILETLYGDDHTKAAIKRENGMDFPARDYALVPDPSRPATWRIRLAATPGVVSIDQLVKAAAQLGPTGLNGNRIDIPPGALAAVKRRIRAEFIRLKVPPAKIPAHIKEVEGNEGSLTVWRNKETGEWRWLAIYSNCFRDDDYPPEIITDKSQRLFEAMVDRGIVDYPEAWLWHVPGTAWGKADMVAYSDGFALATGTVYAGFEHVAENLSKMKTLRVSHGMPDQFIRRDPHDPSLIVTHITREISPLPGHRAANKLTGFFVHREPPAALDSMVLEGEEVMALPAEKKEFLKNVGLSDAFVADLEKGLAEANASAQAAGIESKEQGDAGEEAEEAIEAEGTEESEDTASDAGEETKMSKEPMADDDDEMEQSHKTPPKKGRKKEAAPATPAPNYATREEVAQVLSEVMSPMLEAIKAQSAQVAALAQQVKELSATDTERLARVKEVTPSASQRSLSDLMRDSIIGKEDSRVDGRSTLGKDDGPKETLPVAPGSQSTPVPFINNIISHQ